MTTITKEKILEERTKVSNQLDFPTCTANALCDAAEYLSDDGLDLSRLFVFWNSKKGTHGGAFVESAIDVMKNIGVPPESTWPYSKDDFDTKPSNQAFDEARLRKYNFSLAISKEEIISSVDAGSPVVIGILCPQNFNKQPSDRVFLADDPVDPSYRHAMVIVGYRLLSDGKCHFRVRNSYGNMWMDNGYCWFESDYIIDNSSASWSVLKTSQDESVLSKRNFEFIFGVFLFYILRFFQVLHSPLSYLLFVAFFACLVWRRIYYNNSIIDEINIFKLLISLRNNLTYPVLRTPRKIINSFLR